MGIEDAALRSQVCLPGGGFSWAGLHAEGAQMEVPGCIHHEGQTPEDRLQRLGAVGQANVPALGIHHSNGALDPIGRDIQPVPAVNGEIRGRPEARQAGLPPSPGAEAVDTAVRSVTHIDPAQTIEGDIIGAPRAGQLGMGRLVG